MNKLFTIFFIAGLFTFTACGDNSNQQENSEEEGGTIEERDFGGAGADPSNGTVVSDDTSTVEVNQGATDGNGSDTGTDATTSSSGSTGNTGATNGTTATTN